MLVWEQAEKLGYLANMIVFILNTLRPQTSSYQITSTRHLRHIDDHLQSFCLPEAAITDPNDHFFILLQH